MRTVLAVSVLALIFSAGCSETDSPVISTTDQSSDAPFSIVKGSSPRESAPQEDIITGQALSINAFALDLYKYLAAEDGNIFFSPYSIVAALGMTDAGAQGETQTQIRQALSVTLVGDNLHAALNGLDLTLTVHSQAQE
ncbi:MAG: hypothetical protein GF350_09165, partial [Chitinivibrionales bacterium]|nr:hypothetical protein [Chitinivibrionales bacterium]